MSVATERGVVDQFGYELATSSELAAANWCTAIDRVGTYSGGVRPALDAAKEADPEFVLPHGLEGYMRQMSGDRSGSAGAFETARQLAGRSTERERSLLNLLVEAAGGNHGRVASLGEEHLARFPVDRLAAGLAVNSLKLAGGKDGNLRADALLDKVSRSCPADDWWLLSHRAYVINEQGRGAEARALAEVALTLQPRSGQAMHTVTHCDYEEGHHQEGRVRLESWMADYDKNGVHWIHFNWHLSLFDLVLGELDLAFRRANAGEVPLETASFLWRCTLHGVAVRPERWGAGANALRAVMAGPVPMTRLNLGYAALAAAGSGDVQLQNELIEYTRQGENPPAAIALVEGVIAFGRGEFDVAVVRLEASLPGLEDLGGSNLQRQVFLDTLAAARSRRPARL